MSRAALLFGTLVMVALAAAPVAAHAPGAEQPLPLPSLSWSYEPAVVLPLCALGALWLAGLVRSPAGRGARMPWRPGRTWPSPPAGWRWR